LKLVKADGGGLDDGIEVRIGDRGSSSRRPRNGDVPVHSVSGAGGDTHVDTLFDGGERKITRREEDLARSV